MLRVQLINEDCMYVVSINDCGEERNFLATRITFTGSQLNATINGTQRKFDVGQLIDIETVNLFEEPSSWARTEPKQRGLS
jgi:hypothetical protein